MNFYKRTRSSACKFNHDWPTDTELLGLVFELVPRSTDMLYAQYTVGLHAWFLDQVRQTDPDLSAYLHDGRSEEYSRLAGEKKASAIQEKPFTISALEGKLVACGKELQLQPEETYRWYVTVLSKPVVQWLSHWMHHLPEVISLRNAPLLIRSCEIALVPTTYRKLFSASRPTVPTLKLSFLTPTSFRRKRHHFPLPVPSNVFHSYLRRWNDFSGLSFEQEKFLAWVDDCVVIQRHRLESVKVAAGKKGMVTGFTGAVEFSLSNTTAFNPEFEQLFWALGQFAPYCGTGHKTTFGLGQTRLGWLEELQAPELSMQSLLAQRIAQLTEQFISQRKRTGGTRAIEVAETWATILARRELGESLHAIASDMEIPYQTVKTYVKLARRSLTEQESGNLT